MKTRSAAFLIWCLLGTRCIANSISVGLSSGAAGDVVLLPMNFVNTHEIVAMQFDLEFSVADVTIGLPETTGFTMKFIADSREVAAGKRRVVVFSRDNSVLPSEPILEIPVTLVEAVPPPGIGVTITNVIVTDRRGRSYVPAVNGGAWEAWLHNNFTLEDRNNPEISGDTKDPDGDLYGNFLEFLMGTRPRDSQSSPAFNSRSEKDPTDGRTYQRLTFNMAKYLTTETIRIETSTDLVGWGDANVILVPTGLQNSVSREYEVKVEMGEEGRRFFRLAGERAPGP